MGFCTSTLIMTMIGPKKQLWFRLACVHVYSVRVKKIIKKIKTVLFIIQFQTWAHFQHYCYDTFTSCSV